MEATFASRALKQKVRWQRECKHLGGGTFGQVYMERCMEAGRTEEKRAVKRIGKIKTIDYKRELEALAVFSYKTEYQDSFVRFIGWYETDKHIHIVMDLHELGSLDGYLASAQYSFHELDVKLIVTQILEALAYTHKLRFMHRDLKPANVLVVQTGPQWWVKVADFGFSKRAVRDHTAMQTGGGTPSYMAPEMQGLLRDSMLLGPGKVSYSSAVDIWAVGIMAHQVFTGRTPFYAGELAAYCKGNLPFPTTYMSESAASNDACNFVQRLVVSQPDERPNARECLEMAWLLERVEDTGLDAMHTLQPHSNLAHFANATQTQDALGTWSSEQSPDTEPATPRRPTSREVALSNRTKSLDVISDREIIAKAPFKDNGKFNNKRDGQTPVVLRKVLPATEAPSDEGEDLRARRSPRPKSLLEERKHDHRSSHDRSDGREAPSLKSTESAPEHRHMPGSPAGGKTNAKSVLDAQSKLLRRADRVSQPRRAHSPQWTRSPSQSHPSASERSAEPAPLYRLSPNWRSESTEDHDPASRRPLAVPTLSKAKLTHGRKYADYHEVAKPKAQRTQFQNLVPAFLRSSGPSVSTSDAIHTPQGAQEIPETPTLSVNLMRGGRTLLLKNLVHRDVLHDLAYPYNETTDTFVVYMALNRLEIDEVITLSKMYKVRDRNMARSP